MSWKVYLTNDKIFPIFLLYNYAFTSWKCTKVFIWYDVVDLDSKYISKINEWINLIFTTCSRTYSYCSIFNNFYIIFV